MDGDTLTNGIAQEIFLISIAGSCMGTAMALIAAWGMVLVVRREKKGLAPFEGFGPSMAIIVPCAAALGILAIVL